MAWLLRNARWDTGLAGGREDARMMLPLHFSQQSEGLQRHRRRTIKRMARLTLGRSRQGKGAASAILQLPQKPAIPLLPGTAVPPAQPKHRAWCELRHPPENPTLVLPPHRLARPPQQQRFWRHPGEKIQHLQTTESPVPGVAAEPPQGGIVAKAVGPGGIEADEQQPRSIWIPAAPQPPSVVAAPAEHRASLDDRPTGRERSRPRRLWQAVAINGTA